MSGKKHTLACLLLVFTLCCGFDFNEEQIKYTTDRVLLEDQESELGKYKEVYVPKESEEYSLVYRNGNYEKVDRSLLAPLESIEDEMSDSGIAVCAILMRDNHSDTVIIGDSRTLQQYQATDDMTCSWLAQGGVDMDWLMNIAVPLMETEDLQGKKIVIEMGINDLWESGSPLWSAASYLDFYYTTGREWVQRGAKLYIMSVGPVNDFSLVSNAQISLFNMAVAANRPPEMEYIDTYAYLSEEADFVDKLHYDPQTNVNVFSRTIEQLNSLQ